MFWTTEREDVKFQALGITAFEMAKFCGLISYKGTAMILNQAYAQL